MDKTAARVMTEEYNESCGDWSNESIFKCAADLKGCVTHYHRACPKRFEDVDQPFVVAEFGCATGAASVVPLRYIIEAVREIQPLMVFQIYLNDLPENHHSLAIQAVSKGLEQFSDVYIMVAGKDFTH